ncbi:MAG TPA: hypothetical protein VJC09_00720 [Candidatus Saccharimonadales bacterium]|nr:hypothetical protein [Candidatus Saccharimonadales bacterium]
MKTITLLTTCQHAGMLVSGDFMTTKATFYTQPKLYKALKIRAAETDQSISDLINRAIAAQLDEDLQDIRAIRARADDPTESYEEFLTGLKGDGLL